MEINLKQLRNAGIAAGAMTAIAGTIWGALAFTAPYLQTKPPFAPQSDLLMLAQQQRQQGAAQQQMQATQLFLLQKLWENQAIEAQIALRKNPTDVLAQRQLLAAQQALDGLQRQLMAVGRTGP